MTQTAAELEQEVEASRSELNRTVGALKDKMTPGQLFDEAAHSMGGVGGQIMSKLVDQAKENPLPVALVGVGLAWLMMGPKAASASDIGSRTGSAPSSGAPLGDIGGTIAKGFGHAGDAVFDRTVDLKEGVGHLASQAASAVGSTGDRIARAAASTGDLAETVQRTARRTMSDTFEREPLIIGAIGVAIGVALAAALPSSPIEDEKMGGLRDDLLKKSKAIAQDQLHAAQGAVAATYAEVRDEIGRQAGPEGADTLPEKIGQVAEVGIGELQDRFATPKSQELSSASTGSAE